MLENFGLKLSHGHKYYSTDDEHAVSSEDLEFVVFHANEMPKGKRIKEVDAWSRETEVYLDDGSKFEGEIWHSSSEENVIEDAIAECQQRKDLILIKNAFQWAAVYNPKYLEAIAHRKTGSQWNGTFVWEEVLDCNWKRLPKDKYIENIHKQECDYFVLNMRSYMYPKFMKGLQNIRLLKEFSRKELKQVFIQEGDHGIELVSSLVELSQADECWLIIGDASVDGVQVLGQKMPWTCFPGQLTASIKHVSPHLEWDGSVLDLWAIAVDQNIPFAVKGLN